jgi:signal transduction histidine kinase
VRNPLGAIEGFARLLVSDLRSQPQSQCLADKIVRAARQLNSVVGNLLTYTRDLPARSGAVELRALLHDLAGFYRATADDLGIALIVEPGPPLPVLGDPALLQQALTNVLVNAFDACPIRGQGRIVLAGQVVGDQVVVAISDNGCGMTPEVAERIFEPFFTIKDGGIGLGLALCQRIVESHRGQLGVVTQTGLGTTMRLSFPAHGDSHD